MKGSCSSLGSKLSLGGKSSTFNLGRPKKNDNSSNFGDDRSEKSSFSRSGKSTIPRLFGNRDTKSKKGSQPPPLLVKTNSSPATSHRGSMKETDKIEKIDNKKPEN